MGRKKVLMCRKNSSLIYRRVLNSVPATFGSTRLANRHIKIVHRIAGSYHTTVQLEAEEYDANQFTEFRNEAYMFGWIIDKGGLIKRRYSEVPESVDKIKQQQLRRPIVKQCERHIQEPNF
jgi:hypothetical protein